MDKTNKINNRKETILFFIISLLFFVTITAFDPFISSYAKDLGFDSVIIGSIIGISGIVALLTRLPIGVFSDMLHKRRLFIQMGLLITIVMWTLAFFIPNATTLYLGKISDGLTGSTWVIYNVMFASYFGVKEAAKAVAILGVASPVGSILGTTIGAVVANNYGYRYSFLVAVAAAILALVLTFFTKDLSIKGVKVKYDKKILVEQITDKKIWVISVLATIALMVTIGTRDTFTPLVATDLGANPLLIGMLANTHLIIYGLAAGLCGALFYKKIGLMNTAILGAVLQGVIIILIPYAENLTMLFLLQAFQGFGYGLIFTVVTSWAVENIPEIKQSTRMGLFQSLYSAGMFLGPVLIGILIEVFSRSTGYLIMGALSIVSTILIKTSIKRSKKEASNEEFPLEEMLVNRK
ncbi:MFS transporter [Peribacillus frigoritolerans]|uniref:MFS transporter n=1 Tax=Peribacillus castrilensis TaxID=2897690 RepID=UPI002DCCE4F9|nr:MFS transporter [Peribacillus castrilensis]